MKPCFTAYRAGLFIVVVSVIVSVMVLCSPVLAVEKDTFSLMDDPLWKTRIGKYMRSFMDDSNYSAIEAMFVSHIPPEQASAYLRLYGDFWLHERGNVSSARQYYNEAGYTRGFNKIGDYLFERGNLREALEFYKDGIPSPNRAQVYRLLADESYTGGRLEPAKEYYLQALNDYETLLRQYGYDWTEPDAESRRLCLRALNKYPKSPEEEARALKLGRLLDKAARYCQHLDKQCIYFCCSEEVTQTADYSMGKIKKIYKSIPGEEQWTLKKKYAKFDPDKIERKLLYQYQLVRDTLESPAMESRTLIKEDGVKRWRQEEGLETFFYGYSKVLFGPIGLMSKHWQRYFYYRVIGEEMVNDKMATIIEVLPLYRHKENSLFGKVWVTEDGKFGILKIQWNPTAVEKIPVLKAFTDRERLKALNITFVSEFSLEKNGLRLPTRFYIEESFKLPEQEKLVLHTVETVFNNYQFFTVNVSEVSYQE